MTCVNPEGCCHLDDKWTSFWTWRSISLWCWWYRELHLQRQKVIRMWETTVEAIHARDESIHQVAEEFAENKLRVQRKKHQLDALQKALFKEMDTNVRVQIVHEYCVGIEFSYMQIIINCACIQFPSIYSIVRCKCSSNMANISEFICMHSCVVFFCDIVGYRGGGSCEAEFIWVNRVQAFVPFHI